jgi:hypothetical protein
MSPATGHIMEEFDSTSELLQAFVVSIFVLGVSKVESSMIFSSFSGNPSGE